MNWFKIAQLNIQGKIKDILNKSPLILDLLKEYNVTFEDIDNHLEIIITDLKGKFAEGNGKKILLDKKLFKNDFFKDNFHFVVHEFYHWLKRRSEDKFYFNDPEEVQSFILAITWELLNGKNNEEIEKGIYPILNAHFIDENRSKKVFIRMLERAKELASLY